MQFEVISEPPDGSKNRSRQINTVVSQPICSANETTIADYDGTFPRTLPHLHQEDPSNADSFMAILT